ncbi:MAG: HAD-IA family hydrolase, partial [Paracoccaceae bacterium]
VAAKKPAPDVFLLALERLGLPATDAIAFEDSVNGLRSANAAGLRTLVTPSVYTALQDFSAADWVVPDLTQDQLPPELNF